MMSSRTANGCADARGRPRTLLWPVLSVLLALLLGMTAAMAAAQEKKEKLTKEAEDGLFAVIHTSKGKITARLFYRRAPMTVMNFTGLAEGTIGWIEPEALKKMEEKMRRSGQPAAEPEMVRRPLYRDLIFHRVRDFMIQSGDPTGTGAGGSGRLFDDEFHPDLRHDRPGMLSMANRGPNTNSSQFFITRTPAPWLDYRHTVFGEVIEGMDVVNRIVEGDKLERIVIERRGAEARAFGPEMAHELAKKRIAELKKRARKTLPDESGLAPVDPARAPAGDQPLKSPGDFQFLVIGHNQIQGIKRLGKVFAYDREEALKIAEKLVRMARAKGSDFPALVKRYTDMPHNWQAKGVENTPLDPVGIRRIFHLKPGQISDPVDLPGGIYIFRRVK